MATVASPPAASPLRARELPAAAFLYIALTLILAWPLSVHPASRLIWNGPDTELYLWTLLWDTHALGGNPLAFFDANICYPQRMPLASTENLIGSTIFAAPAIWLTGNPVLAVNLVALLSCVLCGLGAYVLARRVGARRSGAILAGIIFAFSPPRFARIGQLHLTTVQWVPFGLAAVHAYLDDKRRRDLWLATGFFTLQALTSGHGAVFFLMAAAGLFLWRIARGERPDLLRRIRDFGIRGILLLAPALLLVVPYREVQKEVGLRRILDETWWTDWLGPAVSYIASPAHVPRFIASHLVNASVLARARSYLFPGFLPLLLAAAAFTAGRKTRSRCGDLAFYGLLALVTLWLSMGAPIGPWPWLYSLPGFNFIRVPARFTILTLLALAVLAACGFDRLMSAAAPRKRAIFTSLVAAALVGELAMMPLRVVPYRFEIPAIDRWLDTLPKPFVIAELPFSSEGDQTTYMLHSTAHWQHTLNGYTGFRPLIEEQRYAVVRRFPSVRSLDALAELGVNYVVVHGERYRQGQWPAVEETIGKMPDWLSLVHADGTARVYALHRPAK